MSQQHTLQKLLLVHSHKKSAFHRATEGQRRNSGCSALYKTLQTSEIMEDTMLDASLELAATAWWFPPEVKTWRVIARLSLMSTDM